MPRAGMCVECGRYVWLTDDSACQNGHESRSIRFSYETPGSLDQPVSPPPAGVVWPGMPIQLHSSPPDAQREPSIMRAPGADTAPFEVPQLAGCTVVVSPQVRPAIRQVPPAARPVPEGVPPRELLAPAARSPQPDPVEPTVGAGDMPPAFARFSSGAWGAAPLWALVHRRGLYVFGFLVLGLALFAFPLSESGDRLIDGDWFVAFLIVALLSEALSLWVGFSAHRELWQERAVLRADGRDAHPLTVERYFRRQRLWRALGVVGRIVVLLTALLLIVADPMYLSDVLVGAVLIAGTGAGLFAAYRRPEPRG